VKFIVGAKSTFGPLLGTISFSSLSVLSWLEGATAYLAFTGALIGVIGAGLSVYVAILRIKRYKKDK